MTFPYYPPTNPEFPSRSMTPEWFVEKERLLSLPGAEVRTPQGKVWDCKAIWNGGEGGPPQGSVIVLPEIPTTIYQKLLAAGCTVESHESDLSTERFPAPRTGETMIHLNGEEYRRAFHSAPAFPHNALLPSPDPDAAPGTMRSYRFAKDCRIPPFGVLRPVNRAEYLDGSTWKPVHSVATLRALAELPLDGCGHLLEVKAIAPTAP